MLTQGRLPGSVLDKHVEPFINHLRAAAYAERTLRRSELSPEPFRNG